MAHLREDDLAILIGPAIPERYGGDGTGQIKDFMQIATNLIAIGFEAAFGNDLTEIESQLRFSDVLFACNICYVLPMLLTPLSCRLPP